MAECALLALVNVSPGRFGGVPDCGFPFGAEL